MKEEGIEEIQGRIFCLGMDCYKRRVSKDIKCLLLELIIPTSADYIQGLFRFASRLSTEGLHVRPIVLSALPIYS